MAVVRALLLLAVDRDLGAVHVQHYALGRFESFRLGDQLAIDRGQTGKILPLSQQLRLERLQPGSQRGSSLPDLL